jgi:hypothetical protein
MRFIVAVIQPHKLDAVREALAKAVFRVSPSSRFAVSAARRATGKSIAAPSMTSPMSRGSSSRWRCRPTSRSASSRRSGTVPAPVTSEMARSSSSRWSQRCGCGRVRPELVPCRHRKPRPTGRPVVNRRTKKFRSTSVEGGQSPHMMVTASPLPKAL